MKIPEHLEELHRYLEDKYKYEVDEICNTADADWYARTGEFTTFLDDFKYRLLLELIYTILNDNG